MERYDILERLAVGGMGEVFLARQRGQGGFARTVVIKQLLPDAIEDGESARRLLDEARLAASVAHENVVTVHEVGIEAGRPFLAMEYVHGVPVSVLARRAERRGAPLPAAVAARIVFDVARGLHAAHIAVDAAGKPLGIVHRDVAPKNMLVRADGVSKVLDFGVAAGADRLCRTATGAVPGTLSYMAPEQAGEGRVSARSDQFALGVVLWELLCGQRLFKGDMPVETLRRLFEIEIAAPSSLRNDVTRSLDVVVLRMLERNPANRFRDLGDCARALDDALPGLSNDASRSLVALWVDKLAGDELTKRRARLEDDRADVADARTMIFSKSDDAPLTKPTAGTSVADATLLDRPVHREARARFLAIAAAAGILAVGSAAGALTMRGDDDDTEALTRRWIAREVVEGPVVLGASIGQYAEERGVDDAIADEVVGRLEILMADRLARIEAHWRLDAAERALAQPGLEGALRKADAASKKALARFPPDLAKRALEDIKVFGRPPADWMPAGFGGPDEVKNMIADARSTEATDEMKHALRRAARRAHVEQASVDGAWPALKSMHLERLDAAERLHAGDDQTAIIDAVDARAKTLLADRVPAHFFETAFVLWHARGDFGVPGERLPGYGPPPMDIADDQGAQVALAESNE